MPESQYFLQGLDDDLAAQKEREKERLWREEQRIKMEMEQK